jgi:hypothetical protein
MPHLAGNRAPATEENEARPSRVASRVHRPAFLVFASKSEYVRIGKVLSLLLTLALAVACVTGGNPSQKSAETLKQAAE